MEQVKQLLASKVDPNAVDPREDTTTSLDVLLETQRDKIQELLDFRDARFQDIWDARDMAASKLRVSSFIAFHIL